MSKSKNTVDLRGLFQDLQQEMTASLTTVRKNLKHPTVKGTAAEAKWTSWLAKYLPQRYQVQHSAQVVDAHGSVSEQQDIVIFDRQYTPFLFHEEDTVFIPAEAVYAVFEAKQELDAGLIQYAAKKAESVRRLHRTSAQIKHAGGKYKAKAKRALPRVLAGVLALDSGWAKGRWASSVKRKLATLPKQQRLDFVSILREGTAVATYGRAGVSLEASDEALSHLFLSILAQLQAMGTVPAIDFREYGKVVPTRSI